ncbi:MAG: exodeoxyribonuclease VII large subunit [Lachnospiraceae bacterium]|nr:exodeoxyribonuclease VII large subunit [Lachnospiraceae bacterium]
MANEYTVSQVNSYIGRVLKSDFLLNNICVIGEVSNCTYHKSGHIYFTIKDENSSLPCMMFSSKAKSGLKFRLESGQSIIIRGSIDVYAPYGRYQLLANSISLDGEGRLSAEFEKLKTRLAEKGVFDPMYKKPIVTYAKKIGVVSSATGAVIQDIRNVSSRRNPYIDIVLYPSLVQGEDAPKQLIKAIKALDKMGLDTIIIARGGGSMEDLWCFNDEELAMTIFNADTPIISAVGHETDFTICDFVSDLRAPTPSAAAELAFFDYYEFEKNLSDLKYKLRQSINIKLSDRKSTLELLEGKIKLLSPISVINNKKQMLDEYYTKIQTLLEFKLIDRKHSLESLDDSLKNKMLAKTKDRRNQLSILAEKVNGLSPLNRLSGGYSYVTDKYNKAIRDINDVNIGDELEINLVNGKIIAGVKEKELIKNGR